MPVHPAASRLRAILVALVATALVAAPADAQLGGLRDRLTKKAADKVVDRAVGRTLGTTPADSAAARRTGTAPGAAAATPAPARGAARATAAPAAEAEPAVLPINEANLERLAAALAAEGAARRDAAAQQAAYDAAYRSYVQCRSDAARDPEYETLQKRMTESVNQGSDAMRKASEDVAAYVARKCGAEPTSPRDPREGVLAKALAAGRLTHQQYAILEERVLPYCQIAARGAHYLKKDARLVYTAEEEAALKPRCASLTQVYEAVR